MARILIADDEDFIVRLLVYILEDDGHECIQAADGEMAYNLIRTAKPDLAVIDINMPQIDGLKLTQLIRNDRTLADLPIILVTGQDAPAKRVTGLDCGADDYIAKPFEAEEVKARIRAVLRRAQRFERGEHNLPEQQVFVTCGDISMDLRSREVTVAGEEVQLTPTEFRLLLHFVQHPAQTFTSSDLLMQVWEYPEGTGSSGLVRWYIRTLRSKIEANPSEPQYIRTEGAHGYMLIATGD